MWPFSGVTSDVAVFPIFSGVSNDVTVTVDSVIVGAAAVNGQA